MESIPVEDLLQKVPSAYTLVVLASRRTFDINEGSPKLILNNIKKVSQIALEEIRQGRITFKKKQEE